MPTSKRTHDGQDVQMKICSDNDNDDDENKIVKLE